MIRLLRIILFLGLSACSSTYYSEKPAMPLPNHLAQLQPWCIGRFLINLPAGSAPGYEEYMYAGNKIKITTPVNQAVFQRKVAEREKKLTGTKREEFTKVGRLITSNHSWLEDKADINDNAKIFIFRETDNFAATHLPFDMESHVLLGNKNMIQLTSIVSNKQIAEGITGGRNLISRIKYRDTWEIPTEPGYCFNGGLITGKQEFAELTSQSFGFGRELGNGANDISITLDMRPSVPMDQKDKLLDRISAASLAVANLGLASSMHILRKGNRPLAGMSGQEILMRIRQQDGLTGFLFIWEAQGTLDSVAQPHAHIEMQFGNTDSDGEAVPSPLEEGQAIELWDNMMNSFQLRPNAV